MIAAIARISTFSNFLSLLRAPLGLLFLFKAMPIRIIALLCAMLTDLLDGYIARRYHTVTHLGTILDPLMDRVFVLIVMSIFMQEDSLTLFQFLSLLTRDMVLFIAMIYFKITGEWDAIEYTATFWGKIATFGQFMVLACILLKIALPQALYFAFIVLGAFLARELLQFARKMALEKKTKSASC